jgi:hypothetical protein
MHPVANIFHSLASDPCPSYGGSCSYCQVSYSVPVPAALKFLIFLKGTGYLFFAVAKRGPSRVRIRLTSTYCTKADKCDLFVAFWVASG